MFRLLTTITRYPAARFLSTAVATTSSAQPIQPTQTQPRNEVDWAAYHQLLGPEVIQQYVDLVHQGYDASWESWLRNKKPTVHMSTEFKLALRALGHLDKHDLKARSEGRRNERAYLRDFMAGNKISYETWFNNWILESRLAIRRAKAAKHGRELDAAKTDEAGLNRVRRVKATPVMKEPKEPKPVRAPRIKEDPKLRELTLKRPDIHDPDTEWTQFTRDSEKITSFSYRDYICGFDVAYKRITLTVDCSTWPVGTTYRVQPWFNPELKALQFVTDTGDVLPNAEFYMDELNKHRGQRGLLQLAQAEGLLDPSEAPKSSHITSLDFDTSLDERCFSFHRLNPNVARNSRGISPMCSLGFFVNLPDNATQRFEFSVDISPNDPSLLRTPSSSAGPGVAYVRTMLYIHEDGTLRIYDVDGKRDIKLRTFGGVRLLGIDGPEVAKKYPVMFKFAKELGYWKDVNVGEKPEEI